MNFDFLMQHLLKTSMVALLALASQTARADNEGNAPRETERETQGITFESKNTDSKLLQTMKPTINFGGYIIAKYSISDRSGQATNGGFDLRFVRLYADGHVFNDFYYKFQLEVNGAPGVDKGPRVVDAFMEWQKFDFFRVKLGQFKRPFGFENPYSPLKVGYGCYSQATMKIASIGDRNGEHKSSGRDLGVQIQGDLLPGADGHKWIHYQLGFFNGQGINHADKDHHKDLIGGLWISPIKDLAIGGFGWNGKYTNEKYDASNPNHLKSVKRVRWGVGMKYESDWTVRGEYMSSVGGVVTNAAAPDRSDAWYATIGVPVIKNLKIYGRYDCYRDAKTWSSLRTDYGISGNYHLGKNLIFQLNYTFTDDRTARRAATRTDSRYNTFDVQVTAKF
ncbi:phosphate-selective porin O and P [Prevotella sp. CAG:891]|nr:phosphate-selective porin O and P [Prevotella sp. CAG:891]